MPIFRTINQCHDTIYQNDKDTAITKFFIRKLCNENLVNEEYEHIGYENFKKLDDPQINFILTQDLSKGNSFSIFLRATMPPPTIRQGLFVISIKNGK